MVPVSVRAESERGALGNQVAAMYAPLPIGLADPIARFRAVHEAMRGLKESGQAVGAEMLTSLADFAPPTILSQAARLQARAALLQPDRHERARPAVPALPARAAGWRALYPLVPLAENAALGIAIMSYDGRIDFGLRGRLRRAARPRRRSPPRWRRAIAELAAVAGVAGKPRSRRPRRAGQRA